MKSEDICEAIVEVEEQVRELISEISQREDAETSGYYEAEAQLRLAAARQELLRAHRALDREIKQGLRKGIQDDMG